MDRVKTIVVAPDKCKGSMSAAEFCDTVRLRIRRVAPEWNVIECPLADGGEGTLDCFARSHAGTERVYVDCVDANGRPIRAAYALCGNVALIEAAATCGLQLAKDKNPCKTSSYGVGQQIADAVAKGATHIYLALGGSATNDAGCGMAAALGVVFVDTAGKTFVPVGGTLCDIADIRLPKDTVWRNVIVEALCDVDNVLWGKEGAAWQFAVQKGATSDQVVLLDHGLQWFADRCKQAFGIDCDLMPYGGAAGGLGAGAAVFVQATLRSGIQAVCEWTRLNEAISVADWVVTGEGRFDRTTLHGKTVGEVLRRSKGKQVVVFCGESAPDTAIKGCRVIAFNDRNESLQQNIVDSRKHLAWAIDSWLLSLAGDNQGCN